MQISPGTDKVRGGPRVRDLGDLEYFLLDVKVYHIVLIGFILLYAVFNYLKKKVVLV